MKRRSPGKTQAVRRCAGPFHPSPSSASALKGNPLWYHKDRPSLVLTELSFRVVPMVLGCLTALKQLCLETEPYQVGSCLCAVALLVAPAPLVLLGARQVSSALVPAGMSLPRHSPRKQSPRAFSMAVTMVSASGRRVYLISLWAIGRGSLSSPLPLSISRALSSDGLAPDWGSPLLLACMQKGQLIFFFSLQFYIGKYSIATLFLNNSKWNLNKLFLMYS